MDDQSAERDRRERARSRALKHPMRVRVLEAMRGRSASPTELAREFDERLEVVAYHATILLEAECIEPVPGRSERGTLERFYTARRRSPLGPPD